MIEETATGGTDATDCDASADDAVQSAVKQTALEKFFHFLGTTAGAIGALAVALIAVFSLLQISAFQGLLTSGLILPRTPCDATEVQDFSNPDADGSASGAVQVLRVTTTKSKNFPGHSMCPQRVLVEHGYAPRLATRTKTSGHSPGSSRGFGEPSATALPSQPNQ